LPPPLQVWQRADVVVAVAAVPSTTGLHLRATTTAVLVADGDDLGAADGLDLVPLLAAARSAAAVLGGGGGGALGGSGGARLKAPASLTGKLLVF
jgi:hypothetical protein